MYGTIKIKSYLFISPQCFVIIWLQRNLLHCHYVTCFIVYGRINLPEGTLPYRINVIITANHQHSSLTYLDPSLPGKLDLSCLHVKPVFRLGLVQYLTCVGESEKILSYWNYTELAGSLTGTKMI